MRKLSADVVRTHKGISFVGVVTCFFTHDGNGEFYMAKRSQKARDEHGRWEIQGGSLKLGQTAIDNVKREVHEETGTVPSDIQFLGYRDVFRTMSDGTITHWLSLDFAVRVHKSDVRINEPDKFDEGGWFTLDRQPSPVHSQHPIFLKKYAKEIKELLSQRH